MLLLSQLKAQLMEYIYGSREMTIKISCNICLLFWFYAVPTTLRLLDVWWYISITDNCSPFFFNIIFIITAQQNDTLILCKVWWWCYLQEVQPRDWTAGFQPAEPHVPGWRHTGGWGWGRVLCPQVHTCCEVILNKWGGPVGRKGDMGL